MKNTNLIIGNIGTGKTTKYMFNEVNNIINNNENMLFIDNKEEYYKTFSKELKDNGYDVFVINYNDSIKSNGFNPLLLPYKLYKQGNKDLAIKMLKEIALELFKSDSAMDPFWENSASDYFTGMTLILFEKGSIDEINIGSVSMMIMQTENKEDNINKLKNYVNSLDILNPIYTFISGTLFAPDATKGGIISVLKSNLNSYIVRENLLNLLCTNDLDLSNMNNKIAIFVICDDISSALTNLLIDEIYRTNTNFNYILDNFDSLSKIVNLDSLVNNTKNNRVYVITRNIDNVKKLYKDKFIDAFENIVTLDEKIDEYNVGNYSEYPILNKKENKYYNIEKQL